MACSTANGFKTHRQTTIMNIDISMDHCAFAYPFTFNKPIYVMFQCSFPMRKQGSCHVEKGYSVGSNATLLLDNWMFSNPISIANDLC